ncbi:hypothetical protein Nepgr_000955 [Nepenthes gracilis]|uniref:Uncharacterized protein n=1 Tax=Nepenthes gracilis TaxID=150966 RepID=A0AAD3P439_NEPGR|nr:hypothetical protein Nepgr_000955 [Nepenthes gracilis]
MNHPPFLTQPPPPPNLQPVTFNLENKISLSVLLIIIVLAIIFFVSGLLHWLVRFLLRPTAREPDDLENATALQGQLQQLFHLHDAGVPVSSMACSRQLMNHRSICVRCLAPSTASGEGCDNMTMILVYQLASNELSGQISEQLFEIPKYNFTGNKLNCDGNYSHACVSDSTGAGSSLGLLCYIRSILVNFIT